MFLNGILQNNKCTLHKSLIMNETVTEKYNFIKRVPHFYQEVFAGLN